MDIQYLWLDWKRACTDVLQAAAARTSSPFDAVMNRALTGASGFAAASLLWPSSWRCAQGDDRTAARTHDDGPWPHEARES